MQSKELTIHGVDFIVEYSFTKGYTDTLEEPGYDDDIEIISISPVNDADNKVNLEETAETFELTVEQYLESNVLYEAAEELLWYDYSLDKDDYLDYDSCYDGTDEIWDDCYCHRGGTKELICKNFT